MSSFRRPKGVYSRSTPDWFSDQMCFGAGDKQNDPLVANGVFYRVSLFNNDPLGKRFYVYQLNLASDDATFYFASLHSGTLGSFFASCSNIDPSRAAPSGQIFIASGPSYADPPWPPDPTDSFTTFPASGASAQATASGPLFIVPNGYSLVVSSNTSVNQIAIGFYFIALAGN